MSKRGRFVPRILRTPAVLASVYGNAFEFMLALAAVISAVAFFVNPATVSSPALHATLRGWDSAWYALYGIGGLHMVVGLLLSGHKVRLGKRVIAGDGRLELAGLVYFTTALLVNVIAIVHFGYAGTVAMFTYGCLLAACGMRMQVILLTRKVIARPVPESKGGE